MNRKRNKMRGIYLEAEQALICLVLLLMFGFSLGMGVSIVVSIVLGR